MNITKTNIGIAGVVDEGPAGNRSWFCQQISSAPPHRPRKRLWLRIGAIVFAAATAVPGQNLLQNPGFEAGTEGWSIVGLGARIETVTERPHSGAAACRVLDATSLYCGIAQSVLGLMQPGVTYQCSAWVRLDNATGERISILIRQIDESNNGKPRHQILARIIATSNEWTQLTGTYTLDVRGRLKDLIFYFEGPAAGVDFLVDDVSVTPAQTAEAQTRPAQVEPSPPGDEAWNRIERLALMFGLFVILLSVILAALLLAWLAARSRRGEQAGGSPTDQPPLEGAGATRTARWPWAAGIAAVVLLIPMGLITGWLLLRYFGKAVAEASPEQPNSRQATFEEILWNPGFEAGLEPWGWPGGWWTIATTTYNPHSGRQAAIVSHRTDSWQGIGQSLRGRIETGRVYYCSAWVRIANAPEAVVTLHVTKIDDSNNGAMSDRFLGSRKVVENEWTEIHGTHVLDDLTGSLRRLFFYLGGPPPGVNLVVDDVSIAPAQTAEAQTRPAQVEPSPPRDEAWNRTERLALMFGLFVILLSAILAALLLAWLAARSRRGEHAGGGAMDQPPTGAEAPPKRGSRLEKLLWFGSVSLLLTVIFGVWQAWPRRMPQSAKTAETIPPITPEVRGGLSSRWTWNAPRFIPPTVLPEVRGGMPRDSRTGTKPTLQQADTNGVFVLKAIEAEIHGQIARYEEPYDCIGFWMVREDYVSWTCDVTKPGRFSVAITYACAPGNAGSQYTVGVEAPAVDREPSEAPGSKLADTVKATGGWSSFITEAPGEIELSAGRHKIAVRALTMQSAVMNLRQVKLSPLR